MGSYAVVKLAQGQLSNIEVMDIYVPDGQFQGFVTPPPGVAEYLSSGSGLRLPDANWWPDFPSSATRILPFMGMGQNQAVDGVVAVNLAVVEKVLQVVGPVYLPDYQTEVTAETFAEVARSDRDEFFPGSIAKVQFLSHFMTQLKLKLSQLNTDQIKEIFKVLDSSLASKDIQLFSNQPALQELLHQYQITGELNSPESALYFMSIESNVGINKANRSILRSAVIDLGANESNYAITFTNQNPITSPANLTLQPNAAPHFHYVNYQRFLLNPTASITQITIDGAPITDWDEEIILSSAGQQFKQLGFLVEIPEQTNKTVNITFSHPPLETYELLTIQKQSGTPPSPLEISSPAGNTSVLLETDLNLKLSEL
jgi:hypothetical protein